VQAVPVGPRALTDAVLLQPRPVGRRRFLRGILHAFTDDDPGGAHLFECTLRGDTDRCGEVVELGRVEHEPGHPCRSSTIRRRPSPHSLYCTSVTLSGRPCRSGSVPSVTLMKSSRRTPLAGCGNVTTYRLIPSGRSPIWTFMSCVCNVRTRQGPS